MTSDEVTELHNDLMRRAKACDNLAAPPVYPPDAVRSKGRADAFRHAAELLLASPLAAEVARLTAERDAAHAARVRAEAEVDGRGRDLAAVARERDALRATLARVEAATAAVSSLPWPLPVPTREEWDAMPAAEKAVRDAVGQWRRLAVERGAEVERLTAGRGEVMDAIVAGAEMVSAERDLYRAALADAASGEAWKCDTHHGGVLATQVHADGVAACDACATGDGREWTDTPHAAAIRRALKATEGER